MNRGVAGLMLKKGDYPLKQVNSLLEYECQFNFERGAFQSYVHLEAFAKKSWQQELEGEHDKVPTSDTGRN